MAQGRDYEAMEKNLYVIVNNKLGPDWETVRPRLSPIAQRSLSSLIKSQARGALTSMYLIAKRDDIGFHYVSIPEDFHVEAEEEFDPRAMSKVFDLGFQMALKGGHWERLPPNYSH